jgi:hypothetical protein
MFRDWREDSDAHFRIFRDVGIRSQTLGTGRVTTVGWARRR